MRAESLAQKIRRNQPETIVGVMTQRARAQAELDAQHPDPLTAPIAASLQRSTMRLVDRGLVAAPAETTAAAAPTPDAPLGPTEAGPLGTMAGDLALMNREQVLALRTQVRADANLSPALRAHFQDEIGRRLVDIGEEDDLILSVKETSYQAPSVTPSEHEPADEFDAEYGLGDELVPDPIPWGDTNAMAELSW